MNLNYTYLWMFSNVHQNSWYHCDKTMNSFIENAYNQYISTTTSSPHSPYNSPPLTRSNINTILTSPSICIFSNYIFDFENMTQTNTKTNTIRKIKRVTKIPYNFNYVWRFEDDENNYKDYNYEFQINIEDGYNKYLQDKKNISYDFIIGTNVYTINYEKLTQKNKITDKIRKILRDEIEYISLSDIICCVCSTSKENYYRCNGNVLHYYCVDCWNSIMNITCCLCMSKINIRKRYIITKSESIPNEKISSSISTPSIQKL